MKGILKIFGAVVGSGIIATGVTIGVLGITTDNESYLDMNLFFRHYGDHVGDTVYFVPKDQKNASRVYLEGVDTITGEIVYKPHGWNYVDAKEDVEFEFKKDHTAKDTVYYEMKKDIYKRKIKIKKKGNLDVYKFVPKGGKKIDIPDYINSHVFMKKPKVVKRTKRVRDLKKKKYN